MRGLRRSGGHWRRDNSSTFTGFYGGGGWRKNHTVALQSGVSLLRGGKIAGRQSVSHRLIIRVRRSVITGGLADGQQQTHGEALLAVCHGLLGGQEIAGVQSAANAFCRLSQLNRAAPIDDGICGLCPVRASHLKHVGNVAHLVYLPRFHTIRQFFMGGLETIHWFTHRSGKRHQQAWLETSDW